MQVVSVDEIEIGAITKADAKRAGYTSVAEVGAALPDEPERQLYRVVFKLITDPDPREALANDADLSADDIADIDARLDRLDRASKAGPWTRETLRLIAERPATRAPDLAESVGRETKAFKLDVRKLKNLGLTTSLKIGYQLSPRGQTFLNNATQQ